MQGLIDDLFRAAFVNEIAKLRHVFFNRKIRHRPIYLDDPTKIIKIFIDEGIELKKFKDIVRCNTKNLYEKSLINEEPVEIIY